MTAEKDKFHGFGRHHIPSGPEEHRKGRGLIQLYMLHSLSKEPKSGYDLIKEISEKTQGAWVPSKGSLYPMLKKMEEDNLIRISETGKRSKIIYELDYDGTVLLKDIIEHRKDAEEKMYVFRELMFEIFSGDLPSIKKTIFEIRSIAEKIPPEKENEAVIILEKTLSDLKGLK